MVPDEIWSAVCECCDGRSPWPMTMIGGVGVGKTCAALCVYDVVCGGRRYVNTADMVKRITDMRRDLVSDSEADYWRDWRNAKLVILDELGARERVSDAHYEIVKNAIDQRAGRPAIFISNLSLGDLAGVYDDRIASRLAGGTVVDMMDWTDRRLEGESNANDT